MQLQNEKIWIFFCKDDTSSGFNFKVSSERQSSINEAICLETRPAAPFPFSFFVFFYEIADQPWHFNLPIFLFFFLQCLSRKKALLHYNNNSNKY